MARELVYIKTGKPVLSGDVHRVCGWRVEVGQQHANADESRGEGSVTVAHLQGHYHAHLTYAANIGAHWIDT
jgi:hypothetical protein